MIVRIVVFGRKMDLVVSKENGVILSILIIKKATGNGSRLGQAEGSVFSQDKDSKCLR